MNKDVLAFRAATDIEEEITEAKVLLEGAQTYVEHHLQEGTAGVGNVDGSIVNYNAGNIHIMMSIIWGLLNDAEKSVKELFKAMGYDTGDEVSA